MGIKLIICICALLAVFALAPAAHAATNQATFSFSTDQTTVSDGSNINVTLNVDAGGFGATLSTLDLSVKISDTSIVEPADITNPFTPGTIFSKVSQQEYSNGVIHFVAYIDPDNKPATRSGAIGTIALKAKGSGNATLTYDNVSASEEGSDLGYVSSVSSSLTLQIDNQAVAAPAASKTSKPVVASAQTGPSDFAVVALFGALALFFFYKYSQRERYI